MTDPHLRVVCLADVPARHSRLVCPRCYGDTATGFCFTCCIDWCDGLSDWLIRPRGDLSAVEALLIDDTPRERRNPAWRKQWLRRGALCCSWCDVTEADAPGVKFEIDHVEGIAQGGPDEFENTRVLCVTCHRLRATMQAHTRRMRRRERDEDDAS
jgi:hypothetical protein